MFDLTELQRKLDESRGLVRQSKVRIRTAAVEDASKLLKAGLSPCEISDFMNLPKSVVMAEKARLDEREEARRRYLNSLNLELLGQMAHLPFTKGKGTIEMKAKELNPNLFPQREVVKAYQDVGQEYELTIHDRGYQMKFYPLVTANHELKEQEVEYRINQMMRRKDKNGEWLTFQVSLFANDWEGNRIDYPYTEGKIEDYPVFRKKRDPQTKEVIPEKTEISELKDIYTIPFTKAKVKELSKYFSETIGFAVRDGTGRRQSCSLEQFTDLPYEELVKQTTSYMHTDDYRNKQLIEAMQKGGIK